MTINEKITELQSQINALEAGEEKTQLQAILDRASAWQADPEGTKATIEAELQQSLDDTESACEDFTTAMDCAKPKGCCCFKLRRFAELNGIDADNAREHGIPEMVGFKNKDAEEIKNLETFKLIVRIKSSLDVGEIE